jgi:hypothetical protein
MYQKRSFLEQQVNAGYPPSCRVEEVFYEGRLSEVQKLVSSMLATLTEGSVEEAAGSENSLPASNAQVTAKILI